MVFNGRTSQPLPNDGIRVWDVVLNGAAQGLAKCAASLPLCMLNVAVCWVPEARRTHLLDACIACTHHSRSSWGPHAVS